MTYTAPPVTTGGGGPPGGGDPRMTYTAPPVITTGGGGPPGGGDPRMTYKKPPVIPKGRTYPGGIASTDVLKRFLRHRETTQQLKGMVGQRYFYNEKTGQLESMPNYTHALGGYDWKQNFPETPEWLDKGLAYGYQHLTEATRALMDPTSYGTGIFGLTQNLGNAFNKANVEVAKNVQGFTGEGIPEKTLHAYHSLFDPNYQSMANGGIADFYKNGGFSG
jgi:hypothetical protein